MCSASFSKDSLDLGFTRNAKIPWEFLNARMRAARLVSSVFNAMRSNSRIEWLTIELSEVARSTLDFL